MWQENIGKVRFASRAFDNGRINAEVLLLKVIINMFQLLDLLNLCLQCLVSRDRAQFVIVSHSRSRPQCCSELGKTEIEMCFFFF